jgi:hypothetical protein
VHELPLAYHRDDEIARVDNVASLVALAVVALLVLWRLLETRGQPWDTPNRRARRCLVAGFVLLVLGLVGNDPMEFLLAIVLVPAGAIVFALALSSFGGDRGGRSVALAAAVVSGVALAVSVGNALGCLLADACFH